MSRYKVHLIESERGWGQRIDEVKYFDTKDEALSYIHDYNSENTAIDVPDSYMFARYAGEEKSNDRD